MQSLQNCGALALQPDSLDNLALLAHDSSYRLLKEAQKTWQHFVSDKLVHLFQPDKIALDALMGIAKDYVKGHAWIEAHVWFEAKGRANHACVIIKCAQGNGSLGEIGEPEAGNVFVRRDPAMLVDVAHAIESPQETASDIFYGLRSDVWLKRLNDADCPSGHTPRVLSEGAEVLGRSLEQNRELGALGIRGVNLRQRKDELIERRPKTVEEVANDERQYFGNVLHVDTHDVPLSFKVILTRKTYRIGFDERADAFPQVLKVIFRPSGLQIRIG
jgi:hypothetical protein